MIYFFDSRGDCIQKWNALGDAITLQPMIRQQYADLQALGCAHHALCTDDLPQEEICWFDGRMVRRSTWPVGINYQERARLVRLLNLPQPCRLVVNGTIYDWTEPVIELDLVYSGSYDITVVAPLPYRDARFVVRAP